MDEDGYNNATVCQSTREKVIPGNYNGCRGHLRASEARTKRYGIETGNAMARVANRTSATEGETPNHEEAPNAITIAYEERNRDVW